MELPYKIKIYNSLSVKIGYSLLMLFMLSCSILLTFNEFTIEKIANVISIFIIQITVIYVTSNTIYRLFTEVSISDDLVEIKNLFNTIKISKNQIIGYQGGLRSYVDPKFKFRNFSYSKYIFTENKVVFFFIEDNTSAFYFNNSDGKRPIEVIENVDKQIKKGLKIKPKLLKGSITLLFISLSIISGWYLSLIKINDLDSSILFLSGIVLLGYSAIRLFLYFYAFIIRKTSIVIYEDKIEISNRWQTQFYSYEDIQKNNKKLYFIKYNKLVRLIIGKYLFNGNEYITNKIFVF